MILSIQGLLLLPKCLGFVYGRCFVVMFLVLHHLVREDCAVCFFFILMSCDS